MSPVSPVFHTEATESIGLKNVLGVGTSILFILLSATLFYTHTDPSGRSGSSLLTYANVHRGYYNTQALLHPNPTLLVGPKSPLPRKQRTDPPSHK